MLTEKGKKIKMAQADRMIDQIYDLINDYAEFENDFKLNIFCPVNSFLVLPVKYSKFTLFSLILP